MTHHWVAVLTRSGTVAVSETAQVHGQPSITIGEMVTMHAAVVAFAHTKVHQMLETHSETPEDYRTGMDSFCADLERLGPKGESVGEMLALSQQDPEQVGVGRIIRLAKEAAEARWPESNSAMERLRTALREEGVLK
jgi:hypothetical protein